MCRRQVASAVVRAAAFAQMSGGQAADQVGEVRQREGHQEGQEGQEGVRRGAQSECTHPIRIDRIRNTTFCFSSSAQKWVPTYGFKRADAERQKEWVLEVPKNAHPMEDQFQKKMDMRSEKVAANEIKRMKNIVRAKKLEVPRAGYLGPEAASSSQLLTAASVAKASTASVGKFQEKLPKEKAARGLGVKELMPGAKRKASHIGDEPENVQNLALIQSVLNKKPKFDVDRAITVQKREARAEREANPDDQKRKKKSNGSGAKRSRKGGKIRSSGSKKPKGGQGERDPKKKASGRKRR